MPREKLPNTLKKAQWKDGAKWTMRLQTENSTFLALGTNGNVYMNQELWFFSGFCFSLRLGNQTYSLMHAGQVFYH